jgi:uncharacterized cupredoxin-like copper-binding protein
VKERTVKGTLIAAAVAAVLTAACGGGGDGKAEAAPDRIVEFEMVELAFKPATLTAKAGERIRLVFRNEGTSTHDAFIGDAAAQAEHEKEMRQPEEGGHEMNGDADQDAVTVEPGKKGELIYTFDRPGTLEIGCHEPGHYAAGMRIPVTVT